MRRYSCNPRPESGLVIEKALCQIGGTLSRRAIAGLPYSAGFTPHPELALDYSPADRPKFWVSASGYFSKTLSMLCYGGHDRLIDAAHCDGSKLEHGPIAQNIRCGAVEIRSEIVVGDMRRWLLAGVFLADHVQT